MAVTANMFAFTSVLKYHSASIQVRDAEFCGFLKSNHSLFCSEFELDPNLHASKSIQINKHIKIDQDDREGLTIRVHGKNSTTEIEQKVICEYSLVPKLNNVSLVKIKRNLSDTLCFFFVS